MAEIQMFQPGTAFMNSYNQAKAGSLAKIAFTEPQRRQSALADLYGLDPQAANSMKKEFDAQEQEQLKTFATAFLNTPDELKPQMYARAKEMWRPRFQALGSDIPDDWKQALPTIQALAGAGKGKYTGAPIIVQTENGPKYARYSDSGIELTQFAPDDRFTMNVDAEGNVRGYNTRRNVLTPTADGSQQQDVQTIPPPAGSGGIVFPEDIPPAAARVSDIMEAARREIGQLVSGGMPVDQATTLVTQKYARGRGLTMPTQGQAPAASQSAPTAPPRQAPVTPARVAVKQPEGKVETWGTPTAVVKDGKTVMIQLSNLGNERVRSDLSPADSNKAPSGEASNAAGFYSRMEQSERLISQIEAGGYSPSKNKGDFFTAGGTFTNWATSPKGRQYYNAASNWIRANLRKESGAAIGVDEMKQEFATYFPVPGDDKDTIEQKRLLRQQTAEAVRQAGAPAMRYQERTQGQQGQQGQNFDPLGILK